MKIGPRFKIARRLGNAIYDKTQTQKYMAKSGQKNEYKARPRSDFGIQLLEKQKARYTYGISEKQFGNYVKKAILKKGANTEELLYLALETRLDNVIYRLGLANSRAFARQLVSHGHIYVNNRKVTIPSYAVKVKDQVSIKPSSLSKPLFLDLDEKLKSANVPNWISFNLSKKVAMVDGTPKLEKNAAPFDISAIAEFYKR